MIKNQRVIKLSLLLEVMKTATKHYTSNCLVVTSKRRTAVFSLSLYHFGHRHIKCRYIFVL